MSVEDIEDIHHDDDIEIDSWELPEESLASERVKKLALSAIFAALSVAIAPVAQFIPRIPGWGIALFDPSSLFWIIAFLIGGPWVGGFSMIVGTIVLNFFDPTAPIGPLLKFLATAPMILIPYLGVMERRGGEGSFLPVESTSQEKKFGAKLGSPKRFAILMIFAWVLRCVIMIPVNIIIVPLLYSITDVGFITTYTIILNTTQSIFDALVPFIVVYTTGIYKHYGFW